MRPRVLHVCSDTNIGGAGRYVLTLLARPELTKRYDLAVACPEGELAAAFRQAGIPLMIVPGADASFSVAALHVLYRLIRSWRPGVVHTHGALAGRAAAGLAGVRILYTKHGLASASEQAVQVRSPGAVLQRAAVRFLADRIVAVSHAVANSLVLAGADPKVIRVIPGGVDLAAYGEVSPPVAGTIGALGRLSREKGFDVLLEAMQQVPGRLLLGGDGPRRTALQRQAVAQGLADSVTLTGFVPDVPAFLGQIGLFVLPSRSEGLGLVLVEAMAAGRPVVATRVGGIPEVVVDGETGLLVPPEDPAALAGAIGRLLADSALASRLGEAGRRRAQACFSAERMAEQTAALYAELLGG